MKAPKGITPEVGAILDRPWLLRPSHADLAPATGAA